MAVLAFGRLQRLNINWSVGYLALCAAGPGGFLIKHLSTHPQHTLTPYKDKLLYLPDKRSYYTDMEAKITKASVRARLIANGINLKVTSKPQSHPYMVYEEMMRRCYKPNHSSYQHYGGKGITVSAYWRRNPSAFLLEMGPRPPKTFLHRIDETKPFSKKNCIWGTRQLYDPDPTPTLTIAQVNYVIAILTRAKRNNRPLAPSIKLLAIELETTSAVITRAWNK